MKPRKGESAALAKRRAASVLSYLKKNGVDASSFYTPKGNSPQSVLVTTNSAALEASLNEQNSLAVQLQQRSFQKGDNKVVDELVSKGPGTYTVQKDGRFYAVTINKVLPAGPKTLAEARGQATSDYQNYLEKQWVTQLREKYPVQVNESEVNKLVTK
jgi:peptidyl-prolyl cis-trans isomerase SurA